MKFVLFLFIAFTFSQHPVDKSYLLGRFVPFSDSRFVKLTSAHARRPASHDYLRKETYEAFVRMANDASKEGVTLVIISATRNFDDQKKIWENKWRGKIKVGGNDLTTVLDFKERARLILLYSAMPGTSRHHWGTDIDLNSWENRFFENGEGLKIYHWLSAHAGEYGFCQPYTSKAGGRTGCEEEKWHWSYLPLSKIFLDEYQKQISYEDIVGFEGSEQALSLHIINEYVGGVACR